MLDLSHGNIGDGHFSEILQLMTTFFHNPMVKLYVADALYCSHILMFSVSVVVSVFLIHSSV
jgi:hypothetical protein